ncbi:MAG: NRDE family protein [Pseudomonadota bacterium]|nr:NRDE family protein [Pseudomonadota bacterium]
MAGGSWLGLSDEGVVATVMNRHGTLGPQAGRRSRGELVLKALAYSGATEAATALTELEPALYRSFNLVVADRNEAFWLCHRGDEKQGKIEVRALLTGISMLTDRDCNDPRSPRIRIWLPRFRSAPPPNPEADDSWSAWIALLASQAIDSKSDPESAINVVTQRGFGTVSSSLIALPTGSYKLSGVFLMLGVIPYIVYGSFTELLKCCPLIGAGLVLLAVDLVARFGAQVTHTANASAMPALYLCLVLTLLVIPVGAAPGKLLAKFWP